MWIITACEGGCLDPETRNASIEGTWQVTFTPVEPGLFGGEARAVTRRKWDIVYLCDVGACDVSLESLSFELGLTLSLTAGFDGDSYVVAHEVIAAPCSLSGVPSVDGAYTIIEFWSFQPTKSVMMNGETIATGLEGEVVASRGRSSDSVPIGCVNHEQPMGDLGNPR